MLSGIASADKPISRFDRTDGTGTGRHIDDLSNKAYNVLDINLLRQYVCNVGQFYSSWQELGPTAEWPKYSGHEQMYRMNLYLGIPGNVVQTRTYGEKEWDPSVGYRNMTGGFLAISTDTTTWPDYEIGNPYWPGGGYAGRAGPFSQQDSYAVFRDSTNYLFTTTGDPTYLLNLAVHQTSWAWNTTDKEAEDYIVFQFQIINLDDEPRDSLYFCLYSDFDPGGYESGDEWMDDKLDLDLDRQFYYFYDADNWSAQWNGLPFHVGVVFLQTPDDLGITDFHYTDNYSEPRSIDDDVEQFMYLSSDPSLRADSTTWPNLFHGDDLHYDDPSFIDPAGEMLVCFPSSGPHYMNPGDTLTFITALVAGEDYDDIIKNVDSLWVAYQDSFKFKSVPQPIVYGFPGDNEVALEWTNELDDSLYYDPDKPPSYENSIIGYKIYRSQDPDLADWEGPLDSVLVGDIVTPGLYRWIDTEAVNNGYWYYYYVSAYDDMGAESGFASWDAGMNTVKVRPTWSAQSDMSNIKVVPNPFVISAMWEQERLGGISDGEPVRELAFTNLPSRCEIQIYTMDGDRVKTLQHNGDTGTRYWNLRSTYNQLVTTGIYFFYVKSDQGEHVGRFAVIR
jgi:hypothetical protein